MENNYSKIIDGRALAGKINQTTARLVKKIKQKGIISKLAVVLVGNDPASELYVKRKELKAKELGLDFCLFRFSGKISKVELIKQLQIIQTDKKLSGLIVQLPLPEKIYGGEILNAIRPELDVDCLTDANLGALMRGEEFLEPPTAGAIMEIIDSLKIDLPGKKIVVIGTGLLIGRPLSVMLINRRASVATANSATCNLKELCLGADVIITCAGVSDLVTGEMVRSGAIVIDGGSSLKNGKIVGDIDFETVVKKASYITPTPGGVGPITVSKLLANVALSAAKKIKK